MDWSPWRRPWWTTSLGACELRPPSQTAKREDHPADVQNATGGRKGPFLILVLRNVRRVETLRVCVPSQPKHLKQADGLRVKHEKGIGTRKISPYTFNRATTVRFDVAFQCCELQGDLESRERERERNYR